MTTLLGCIADDFTGATDLAGLLARSGVRVSLRLGVPDKISEVRSDAARAIASDAARNDATKHFLLAS